jgi:hypothetical protein
MPSFLTAAISTYQFSDAFIGRIPSIINADKDLKQAFDFALKLSEEYSRFFSVQEEGSGP